jgi:hypothetical protein
VPDVMELESRLKPHLLRSLAVLRRWRPVLAEHMDGADQVMARVQKRLPGLATSVAVPSTDCRRRLESEILPAAALYCELRDEVGQDRALSLTGACVASDAERGARLVHLLDRTPWLFPILRYLTIHRMRGAYMSPAWEARVLEDTPQRVRLDITRCYYLDTLTSLGIPELTARFCLNDDVIWGDLRHVEFRRAGTLGRGHDACDFCYERLAGPELSDPRAVSCAGTAVSDPPAGSAQERGDLAPERPGLLDEGEVAAVRELDDPATRDLGGQLA